MHTYIAPKSTSESQDNLNYLLTYGPGARTGRDACETFHRASLHSTKFSAVQADRGQLLSSRLSTQYCCRFSFSNLSRLLLLHILR